MAQAMASMAGTVRFMTAPNTRASSQPRSGVVIVRASAGETTTTTTTTDQQTSCRTRRGVVGVVAAGLAVGGFGGAVLAKGKSITVGPPPPPSGGLPGTLNSDQPRDLDLPLKSRFYIQPLTPSEAAARAKESAKDILNVKSLIDKKAWPYVQNDLRSKAEYLRYDLNTVISAKPKDEKKSLKELTGKLFEDISNLDHAAKIKSTPQAEKYYAETVTTLNDVLAKLG